MSPSFITNIRSAFFIVDNLCAIIKLVLPFIRLSIAACICSSVLVSIEDVVENDFDVIVSNPPYIPTDVVATLMPEVSQFEPREALDGKGDGLYFYSKILEQCKNYMKQDGYILFEIGCEQGDAVSTMMRLAGFSEVRVIKDLARNDRVVMGHL